MVELQSLGLMNAYKAYAAEFVTLNGFCTEILVPLAKKAVNIGTVICCKVCQLVVEGTDVRALIIEAIELEMDEQLFYKLIEW